MKVKKVRSPKIHANEQVTYTEAGRVRKIKFTSKQNNKPTIKKISATEYVNLSTGEVLEFKKDKNGNRTDNINGIRRSMEKLRDIINANTSEPEKCRLATLTYAENMTDTERLKSDFKRFMTSFRRYLKKNYCIDNVEYVSACEPQARGAWHCHVLFVFAEDAPFIPNDELRELWGQGFVKITAVDKKIDNFGLYLTAYLSDMEYDDAIDARVIQSSVNGENLKIVNEKRYVKGARLSMYPTGFNLFRTSRGIKRPKKEKTTYGKAKKEVSSAKLTFEKNVKIFDDNGFSAIISDKYYIILCSPNARHYF